MQNIKQHSPQAWLVINEFTNSFVELLKVQYKKGIQEGIYNSVSIEQLANIDKLFIIQVVTNPPISSDEKYTVSKLVREYLNLRLIGLLKR